MNFMHKLFGGASPKAANATPNEPRIFSNMGPSEFSSFVRAAENAAGVNVNEKTAMAVSAVYASVGLLAGAISSMPCHVYKKGENDVIARHNHDLWWLLNEQPAPAWSAAVFREYLVSSLLLHGDGFARIHRVNNFNPSIKSFEPLHPMRVEVKRNGDRLAYTIYPEIGAAVTVDQDDMLHVPGLGFDGLRGMSQLRYALKTAAGIALAADNHSAAFFKNGARPDFALKTPGDLSDEAADLLRNTWQERHSGPNNAHLPAVLAGGLDVKELTMKAEDAQLISTRQFAVEDIARIFGVPPFMIGHTQNTTSWGSGVENMGIGFVKYTLNRHVVKLEQEINRKCFRTGKIFCKFNTAGLERGDLKSRYEAHRIASGRAGEMPFMTINEIRKLENLPPVPDGDKLERNQGSASPSTPTDR